MDQRRNQSSQQHQHRIQPQEASSETPRAYFEKYLRMSLTIVEDGIKLHQSFQDDCRTRNAVGTNDFCISQALFKDMVVMALDIQQKIHAHVSDGNGKSFDLYN